MKPRAWLRSALCLLLVSSIGGVVQAGTADDIVTTAAADGRFRTLTTALTRADLVDALRGAGPFTVFAPTDRAFAALPDGALAPLLEPDNRPALRRVLGYHVVPGRVLSSDLLRTSSATTLADAPLAIGLRVGGATLVEADIECSNGVIHVIDAVLLPKPAAAPSKERKMSSTSRRTRLDVRETLVAAIDTGAPVFNDGHVERCAQIYADAAQRLLGAGDSLPEWDRVHLRSALSEHADDASQRAWNLREAFDEILVNDAFEPRVEASLPEGFPKPGPVGRVVAKRYPRYRAARAQGGGNSFWALFNHIKKNDVEMTAPVEMTMDGDMRVRDMAFLYEGPDQGEAGRQGDVEVVDLRAVEVLSIGIRGRRTAADIDRAKGIVEARLAADGLATAGGWRLLGYNSPMVPRAQQYWELQVPVRRELVGHGPRQPEK